MNFSKVSLLLYRTISISIVTSVLLCLSITQAYAKKSLSLLSSSALRKELAENEKEIEKLEKEVTQLRQENENLESEKTKIEEESKKESETLNNEKQKTEAKLKEVEETSKNAIEELNKNISELQSEIKTVEEENAELDEKLEAAESSLKKQLQESEAQEQLSSEQYESEIKELNQSVAEKTEALSKKSEDLKTLASSYLEHKDNTIDNEALHLIKIDTLKTEVSFLKSDLQQAISKLNDYKSKKEQLEKTRLEETKALTDIIKKNREHELKNLHKIEQLKSALQSYQIKQQKLEASKLLCEENLKKKLAILEERLVAIIQRYKNVVDANNKNELKNLQKIETLNSMLSNAKALNTKLVMNIEEMKEQKEIEDKADSRVEANRLLKIENLSSALSNHRYQSDILKQKNNDLQERNSRIEEVLKKLYESNLAKDAQYKQAIDVLKAYVTETQNNMAVLQNQEPWLKEDNVFTKQDIEKYFGKIPGNKNLKQLQEIEKKKDLESELQQNSLELENSKLSSEIDDMLSDLESSIEQALPPPEQEKPSEDVSAELSNEIDNMLEDLEKSIAQAIPKSEEQSSNSNSKTEKQSTIDNAIANNVQTKNNSDAKNVATQQNSTKNSAAIKNNATTSSPKTEIHHSNKTSQTIASNNTNLKDATSNNSKSNSTNVSNNKIESTSNNYTNDRSNKEDGTVSSKSNSNADNSAITQNKQMDNATKERVVDLAVDAIIDSILKLTNYDVDKTNAAMNLLGTGHELPSKLDALVEVVKEQFNTEILSQAIQEIREKAKQRRDLINSTLNHNYGRGGENIISWNK